MPYIQLFMSISQAQVMDMLWVVFFFLFISFLLHINLWHLGLLLSFITVTQAPSPHSRSCLVLWQVHLSLVPWKTLGLYSCKSTIS